MTLRAGIKAGFQSREAEDAVRYGGFVPGPAFVGRRIDAGIGAGENPAGGRTETVDAEVSRRTGTGTSPGNPAIDAFKNCMFLGQRGLREDDCQ